MTKYVVEESGDFRLGEEGVFNGDRCMFMAPPARLVPKFMDELFDWMKDTKTEIHPLILSSVFHYEFVFIHPFSDIMRTQVKDCVHGKPHSSFG